MKYTRYDMRNRKKIKNYLILGVIFVIAVIFLKIGNNEKINNEAKISNSEINDSISNENDYKINEVKTTKYYVIQCGVFTQKENAIEIKNSISAYGNPFIVKFNDKYKVIFGIFEESTLNQAVKVLNDNKINMARITYTINQSNLCKVEISEIIHAELEIVQRLSDKKVKSIKTDELKKWVNSMKDINENIEFNDVLKKIKEVINKLPEQITKNNIEAMNNSVYEILVEIKK